MSDRHPSTEPFRIDEIWAFISIGADGDEAVVASFFPGTGWLPLIAADQRRLDMLRPIAAEAARQSGLCIRLVKFANREILETINGSH